MAMHRIVQQNDFDNSGMYKVEIARADSMGETTQDGGSNTGDTTVPPLNSIKSTSRWRNLYEITLDLIDRLLPKLLSRSKYFGVVFVILTLVIFGQGGTNVKLNGVGPSGWYSFCAIIIVTHLFSTIVDEVFFFVLNALWTGSAEFILYADCLNGPLSFIITLSVINGAFYDMAVPEATDYWGLLVTTMITIWTFFTIRKFYQRKGFNVMLEGRFNEKLVDIEYDSKVLSLLASYLPNVDDSQARRRPRPNELHAFTAEHPTRIDSDKSDATSTETMASGVHLTAKQRALKVLRAAKFASKFRQIAVRRQVEKQELQSIFSEIVEASAAVEDPGQGGGGNRDRSGTLTANAIPVPSTQRKAENDGGAELAVTFWDRLHIFSQGVLRIHTVNGLVTIRRKLFVHPFSKRLYQLLSHSGRRTLTGKRLVLLLNSTIDRILSGKDGEQSRGSLFGYHQSRELVSFVRESNREKVIERMLKLFHADVKSRTTLTQENIHSTCMEIFSAHKNIASSLNDFGELNRSITSVIDVVFWIAMLIVAQFILKVDTTDLFAPLLTIVFGLSFAVGPMVGNACVAIGYVLFILPYDVGDRVAFGYGANKIIGNVVGITLLHTTIQSIFNERLQLPHHVLFSEKLMNYSKSTNATLEIPINFALTGPAAATQQQRDDFWRKISQYCLEEAKTAWSEIFITAHTIDAHNNALGYSIWVTSRYRFSEPDLLYGARKDLVEKMVSTQVECDIDFMEITQPIQLVAAEEIIGRDRTNSVLSSSSGVGANTSGIIPTGLASK